MINPSARARLTDYIHASEVAENVKSTLQNPLSLSQAAEVVGNVLSFENCGSFPHYLDT